MTKGSTGQSVVIEGYNAVADVRRVRDQLAEEMKGMTAGEKVAFIEAEAAKFRHNYPLHKSKRANPTLHTGQQASSNPRGFLFGWGSTSLRVTC